MGNGDLLALADPVIGELSRYRENGVVKDQDPTSHAGRVDA
jgi:hypothetical protein